MTEAGLQTEKISAVLKKIGFELASLQPHLSGERFLMTRNKMVLVGHDREGRKAIIKISDHPDGQSEIRKEKKIRDLLENISFARDSIAFPKEIYFGTSEGFTIWVTEFIEQDKIFVEHTLEEQFFLILQAFESQEAFHATTFEHLQEIKDTFEVFNAREYFQDFKAFADGELKEAEQLLTSHKLEIDAYCNYLTHTDFVPHNFRVSGRKIYMLDLSAIRFGNRYEGWARFLNYMTIHNPALEKLLSEYVRANRGSEDYLNLRLMRIYKIGYLLDFYHRSLAKTDGDLHQLTLERIDFWNKIMQHIIADQEIPIRLIDEYKEKRDTLRSEEEKERQREFAVA